MLKKSLTILISPVIIMLGYVDLLPADKILETGNFKIYHRAGLTAQALYLSSKIESVHEGISEFFDYAPVKKITVNINQSEVLCNDDSTENFKLSAVQVNLTGDSDKDIEKFERRIFFIFYQDISSGNLNLPENLMNGLYLYYKSNPEDIKKMKTEMTILSGKTEGNVIRLFREDRKEQISFYILFIDFIITQYGSGVFLQLLSDSGYYNGFIEALVKISGDSYESIGSRFNRYLGVGILQGSI